MIYHRCLKYFLILFIYFFTIFECPVGHSKIPDLQELSNQYVHHHDFFHTDDMMNFLKHTELSIFCPHLMAQRITLQVFQGVRRYNSNDFFLLVHAAWGILVSWTGTEAGHRAVKVPSLNHWTARESLQRSF